MGFVALHADYVYSQSCTTQFDSGSGCPDCDVTSTELQGFIAADDIDHPNAMTNGYGVGVTYDSGNSTITLEKGGGVFGVQSITNPSPKEDTRIRVATSGDFDGDGWTDLIIADRGDLSATPEAIPQWLVFLRNDTSGTAVPADWTNPADIRTPAFSTPFLPNPDTGAPGNAFGFGVRYNACSVGVAAADFDKDGHLDVARVRCDSGSTITGVEIFLNTAGDGRFANTADWTFHDGTGLGHLLSSTTSLVATDWNKDGFPDLLLGGATTATGDVGQIHVLIHPTCTPTPCTGPFGGLGATAQRILGGPSGSEVVEVVSTSGDGLAALVYDDFTGDGNKDIVAAGPNEASLRLWVADGSGSFLPGVVLLDGLVAAAPQALLSQDFNLDGKKDLFFAVDAATGIASWNDRGDAFVWYSTGGATPFTAANVVRAWDRPGGSDFDGGTLLDYDHDPSGTLDVFIGDGTGAPPPANNQYFVLANRTNADFVECGEVISAPITLGSISPNDFVVEGVRISGVTVSNGSLQTNCDGASGDCVEFFASNSTPPAWTPATACGPDLCANLNPNLGRDVRIKAVLCSNDPAPHTTTPEIDGWSASIDYQPGSLSFRSGVVVHKGTVYAGGLRQPGNRGRLFAFTAGDFTNVTWEVSEKIDAQGSGRFVYTVKAGSPTPGSERIDFNTSSGLDLRTALGVANDPEAQQVIDWFVSERFEIPLTSNPAERTSLGAVNNSTPAIVGAPGLPLYYAFLPTTGAGASKTKANTFINDNADRFPLIFWGSKDGALHAFTPVTSPEGTDPNAKEKWAFINRETASFLTADKAAFPVDGHYPDGSPTVADIHDTAGNFSTALVMGTGDGGTSFFALDITTTVGTSSPFATIGPTPLWHKAMPNPGNAKSKPIIIRTLDPSLNSAFLTVMATGLGGTPGSGRDVIAVDTTTGAEVWRFEAKCEVTADIVGFETDDETVTTTSTGEPIDGFVDRVVVADNCGYVYKIDPTKRPGVDTVGPLYIASEPGPAAVGYDLSSVTTDPEGNVNAALFYTGLDATVDATFNPTAGVISSDRPIFGTIAARPDSSTRLVLFFGTGGAESVATTDVNNFFAIYADNGEVRNKIFVNGGPTDDSGTGCDTICKKFYGGAVVSETQVAVVLSQDPDTGVNCSTGASEVKVFSIDDVTNGSELSSLGSLAGSNSGLFAGQGAIYLTLLSGEIVRLGEPQQGSPSDPDPGQGVGGGDGYIKGGIIAVSGWRQVLY